MHGPTRIFWANLTPFSLQAAACLASVLEADTPDAIKLELAQYFKEQSYAAIGRVHHRATRPGLVL